MEEQDVEQLLTKITMPWFYSKPVIFSIYCKQKVKPNPKCSMPFRSGKGFIEYNPQEISKLEIPKSRKLLEMELYRIMLRHPYRRKPENCDDTLWYMASNMVIDPKYAVSQGLPYNQNIEFYYDELLKRKKNRKGKTVEIPPEESFEEDDFKEDEKKQSEKSMIKNSENEEDDENPTVKKSEKNKDDKKNSKKKNNKPGKAKDYFEADVSGELEESNIPNGKPGNGTAEVAEDVSQKGGKKGEKQESEINGESGDGKPTDEQNAEPQNENQNDREQSGVPKNGTNKTNENREKLEKKEENKSGGQSGEKKDESKDKNNEENNGEQADNSTDKKDEQNAAAEDNGDATDLWGEDILENEKITKIIELYSDRKSWGDIPENILRETEKVRIQKVSDLKKKIEKFRASISKSNRVLTRMRPNRRTGFDQMGSRYKLRPTKFLVGMDVSGSITDYYLSVFNTIALDICKKENAQMDILPFDAHLKPLCKKIKTVQKYIGGGGTNFQPLINYVQKHNSQYDGLIVFTDGYASKPVIKSNLRIKILWVIIDKKGVQNWMNKRDFAAVLEEDDNPKMTVYTWGPNND